MSRRLRVEYKGAIYHVTVRANGGADLFQDDVDRRYLLKRIAEAAETCQVRVYLFSLMANHFHLVAETPRGNLGRFMQGVLTGYGVYYNRRHQSHGHVTQGRYGARVVEGNDYLLKLSRYVHLNPVKIAQIRIKPLEERLALLRTYPWSSYGAYGGLTPRNEFVEYEPVLALMEGRKNEREGRYRAFVEAGIADDDAEFREALMRSAHGIGSDDFRAGIEERYQELVKGRRVSEDVSFRRKGRAVSVKRILEVVEAVARLEAGDVLVRKRDCRWRAVAARMLCRHGGMTQREAAMALGLRTGVAVSCQLRRLAKLLGTDEALRRLVHRIEDRLDKEQRKVEH